MTIRIDLRRHDLPATSRTIERVAAKAVLVREGHLLLLRSRHGDLEFPGGGLDPGETHEQALTRELREVCGVSGVRVLEPLVHAVERRPAREPGAVLDMVSDFFRTACDPAGGCVEDASEIRLEGYEQDLRLGPVWMDPPAAYDTNSELLSRPGASSELPWLGRETRVLAAVVGILGAQMRRVGRGCPQQTLRLGLGAS